VIDKVASLQEIETHWNIEDVLKANALLDMRIDIEKDLLKKAEANGNNQRANNKNKGTGRL
jgi:hypothetical protein